MKKQALAEETYLAVDWELAVCRRREHSPDLWFNEETESEAIEICQTGGVGKSPCPVREACLQFALSTGQTNGVWGGLSEDQRRVIAWTKSRVKCPGCGSKNIDGGGDRRFETCFTCGLSWRV